MSRDLSAADPQYEVAGKVLADNAELTERQQRPAAANLDAVRRIGGFAMMTPIAYGGSGTDIETMGRVLADLGRSCPSTAWNTGVCATSKLIVARAFDERAQQEYFTDPDAMACGTLVPSGQGVTAAAGVRVQGRWANLSGCEDATWAGLGLMVDGTFSMVVVPTAELTVSRTWDMAGLQGTGSHSLVADDLLVPAHRVVPVGPPTPVESARYSITALAPLVGAARGALDVVNAMFASDRKPFMTAYSRMAESPGARQWLAEATKLVDRATRTMLRVAREADQADEQPLDTFDRARLRLDVADAVVDCRTAVSRMLDLHGSSGFSTANPLQRYWRDLEVGSRHPFFNRYLSIEDYGRDLAERHS